MTVGGEKLGPAMSRLVTEKMATLMTERATAAVKAGRKPDPFGTTAFVASFIASGDVPTTAREALQWAKGACHALRGAVGSNQTDEELAEFILRKLEERKR